jgi:hypothetical protein
MVGQVCYEWLEQLLLWSQGDIVYEPKAAYYHVVGNESHVANGDIDRNNKISANGYEPLDVFVGKYSYTGMTTPKGPDFRPIYYDIVRRYGITNQKQEVIDKLLWDKWSPIV